MAEVLNFSGESDGMLYQAESGTGYKDRIQIQLNHDFQGTTVSLAALDNGIRITADAGALFSFLVRVL